MMISIRGAQSRPTHRWATRFRLQVSVDNFVWNGATLAVH